MWYWNNDLEILANGHIYVNTHIDIHIYIYVIQCMYIHSYVCMYSLKETNTEYMNKCSCIHMNR